MGGVCTFCGARVSLSRSGTSEIRPAAAERLSKANTVKGTIASSSEPLPASSADSESTAVAEARAFKDRLVCISTMLSYHGAVPLMLTNILPGSHFSTHDHWSFCWPSFQFLIVMCLMQVDYDRNAAKRTNVIDDQSDFFEIDSNAWLSDEVR